MAYVVEYKASVTRDLKKLSNKEVGRVLGKLEAELRRDPGARVPLKGEFAGLFRLRVGDYRIIYAKTDRGVLVLRIRHRKEAYR